MNYYKALHGKRAIESSLWFPEMEQITFLNKQRDIEIKIYTAACRILKESSDKAIQKKTTDIMNASQLKISLIEMKIDFLTTHPKPVHQSGRDLSTLKYHLKIENALLTGFISMLETCQNHHKSKFLKKQIHSQRNKIRILDLSLNYNFPKSSNYIEYKKPIAVTGTVIFCVKSVSDVINLTFNSPFKNKYRKSNWVQRHFKRSFYFKKDCIHAQATVIFNLKGIVVCQGNVAFNQDIKHWNDFFQVRKAREIEVEILENDEFLVAIGYIPLDRFFGRKQEETQIALYPYGILNITISIFEPQIDVIENTLKRNRARVSKIPSLKRKDRFDPQTTPIYLTTEKNTDKTKDIDLIPPNCISSKISDLTDVSEYVKNYCIISPSTLKNKGKPLVIKDTSVSIDNFKICCLLGRGHFGKVVLAREKKSGNYYAVKGLKKHEIIERNEIESIMIELEILKLNKSVRHPFLLGLHSAFQTKTHVCMVMEYMAGGDLMQQIQMQLFTLDQSVFYSACVTLGLGFLHKNRIMYRDIKLNNLVMDLSGYIKIADFGLCKMNMGHGDRTNTFCGTPEFIAPEMLTEKNYTNAIDWWSLGVLVYVMLYAKPPFDGDDEDEIFDKIVNEIVQCPEASPRICEEFVMKLLNKNPKFRFGCSREGVDEIMEHTFFALIDWDSLYAQTYPAPFIPKLNEVKEVSDNAVFSSDSSCGYLTIEENQLFAKFA